MNNRIVVYIETDRNGSILPVSLEAVSLAVRTAEKINASVTALIMGKNIAPTAEEVRHYPVDHIVAVDHPLLGDYQPDIHTEAFVQAFEEIRPVHILMAETLNAIDLAPRLAFRIGGGVVTDAVGVTVVDGRITVDKPVFSNNVTAVYTFAPDTPGIVTLRSRSSEKAERKETAVGAVTSLAVSLVDSMMRTEHVAFVPDSEEGPSLENASVIVSGGRGLGGPEGFQTLSELARVLGGVVGASRPPCDLGWIPSKAQVGVTGAIVAPSLYIAVGISGSTQHVAGMCDSKVIVAVNDREDANIFKIAHYGVVGDYAEVIPALTRSLKELSAGSPA